MNSEGNTPNRQGHRIVFIGRVSKSGGKLFIAIPSKLHEMVEYGKKYRVVLELLE
ncbi:MAG: hypothetical protein QXI86_08350 [Ignisphaera sp.]